MSRLTQYTNKERTFKILLKEAFNVEIGFSNLNLDLNAIETYPT